MLAKAEAADIGHLTESRTSSMIPGQRHHGPETMRTITFTSASDLDRELRLAPPPGPAQQGRPE